MTLLSHLVTDVQNSLFRSPVVEGHRTSTIHTYVHDCLSLCFDVYETNVTFMNVYYTVQFNLIVVVFYNTNVMTGAGTFYHLKSPSWF